MVIGIIGGSASGMAAALAAAENKDVQVILMERQARVGRKLQATGNGRCNLTNRNMTLEHYHGNEPEFVQPAMAAFSGEQTLQWFRELGLYTVAEDSGRVYPYSDQANSVVDVLRFALEKPNIRLETGFEVEKVKKTADHFRLEGNGTYRDLPDKLRKTAELRKANPEATLLELAQMQDPPLTKSAINHRMRKIIELSKQ